MYILSIFSKKLQLKGFTNLNILGYIAHCKMFILRNAKLMTFKGNFKNNLFKCHWYLRCIQSGWACGEHALTFFAYIVQEQYR